MSDHLDAGDKLACGLGYKKGLPSFSSFDWHVSVTVTKRVGETDEEFSLRGWAAVEAELKREVESSDELIAEVRNVQGSADDYD